MNQIQEDIICQFQAFEGDKENIILYIMELGKQLPPMDEQHKIEKNTLSGCLSTVWLTHQYQDQRLFFAADSNTRIIKGILNLLLQVLSGQTPHTILNTPLYFIQAIGLHQLLSLQRNNGLANLIKQLKIIAAIYLEKKDPSRHHVPARDSPLLLHQQTP